MEFVINEAVRSCCWRPVAECDCLTLVSNADESVYGYCPKCGGKGVSRERRPNGNDECENGHVYPSRDAVMEKPTANFDESKHPRADDGKFGSGSGTPAKGTDAKDGDKGGESALSKTTAGAAKVAKILAKIARTSYASAKVSAKVVAAGSKVLGSGLKMAYDRYGDKGSIGMFLVANAVYGGSAVLTGGAAPVAAAAFGLAAMETRHLMKKFVKKLDSDTVGGKSFHANSDDADGLAKLCLVVVRRFASATGLPTPEIDLAGVKKILDDNDLTANEFASDEQRKAFFGHFAEEHAKAKSSKAGKNASLSEVHGGMISESDSSGVRLDHSYEGGKAHLLKHGGELVSSKRGVNGRTIETYRVRRPEGDLLATWSSGGGVIMDGKKMPDQWRIQKNRAKRN